MYNITIIYILNIFKKSLYVFIYSLYVYKEYCLGVKILFLIFIKKLKLNLRDSSS